MSNEKKLMQLVDKLVLYSICTIIKEMSTDQEIRNKMLNNAIDYLGVVLSIDKERFVQELINNTYKGRYYRNMFSCENECSVFWNTVLIMTEQTKQKEFVFRIVRDLYSVLIQIENKILMDFSISPARNITSKKMNILLIAIKNEYEKR